MLGRHSPQGELFRPDNIHMDHVGRDTFYGQLAQDRHRLFRDQDFADLYREDWGRPSVPPSQLCVALLLQAKDGVSDEEAIQRSAFDLRWKVALGIGIDEKLCAKSTLQEFRAKLVLNERFQKLFEASVASCRRAGLLKRKKLEVAIDTTPIFGRGAVKDTFNLVSDQIARVVDALAALKKMGRDQLIAEHGLSRHFSSSFKSQVDVDWDDVDQKRALVAQLVADARIALELARNGLRGYAANADKTADLRAARKLLSELLLQDIEESPGDGGPPCIKQGTKKDRIVSTTDPEMRHGRKSHSKTFDGYKASVVADVAEGVILATDVIAANAHDSEGAPELVAQAGKAAKQPVATTLADTAFGSKSTRDDIKKATKGASVIAKAPPAPTRRATEFTASDFDIDLERGVARCPAGKKSSAYSRNKSTGAHRFSFSRNDCSSCPVRAKCTTQKVASRKLSLSAHYAELQAQRTHQRTAKFKRAYRKRVVVEHRIARLVQLGARQARYFGRAKVAFQVCMTACVANLTLACGALCRGFSGLQAAAISLASNLVAFLVRFDAARLSIHETRGHRRLGRLRYEMAGFRPRL